MWDEKVNSCVLKKWEKDETKKLIINEISKLCMDIDRKNVKSIFKTKNPWSKGRNQWQAICDNLFNLKS